MAYTVIGRRLPQSLAAPLFGDRLRHGKVPRKDDPHWQEWLQRSVEFYKANQRQSIGRHINDAGHKVMRRLPLAGARVLEIGPGGLDHIDHWIDRPAHYTCLDVNPQYLELATRRLTAAGVPHDTHLLDAGTDQRLPFADGQFDVVVCFYSLEHIYPLRPYLAELSRVLRAGGKLIGAIPSEGGLAWGMGRYVTSRRWLLRHTTIDPGKIICWEHPNFADEILDELAATLKKELVEFWPLRVPSIDANLIVKFIMSKG